MVWAYSPAFHDCLVCQSDEVDTLLDRNYVHTLKNMHDSHCHHNLSSEASSQYVFGGPERFVEKAGSQMTLRHRCF